MTASTERLQSIRLLRLRSPWLGAAFGCLAFLVPVATFWGFSVDDAWIVARVVARGLSEDRFSFHSWSSDAVTPLGYERLIGLFAVFRRGRSVADALSVARILSALSMFVAAGVVGWGLVRGSDGRRTLGTFWLALLVGAGAYASSGLETGFIVLLVTLGGRGRWEGRRASAVELGLLGRAAGLRHELAPFCAYLAWWGTSGEATSVRLRGVLCFGGAFAVLPFARLVKFGTSLPLSFEAKLPDPAHGVRYVLGALALSGLGALVLAAPGGRRKDALFATGIHLAAVGFAGGDWMPLHRLVVPIQFWLVGVVFAAEGTMNSSERTRAAIATGLGLVAAVLLTWAYASDARAVIERRAGWIGKARAPLHGARAVATVDIGWVSAAFPGEVVDLAGVTDPRVGRLPGGHTSKHLSPGFFVARNVDAWILRDHSRKFAVGGSLREIHPVYEVDARLLPSAEDLGFVAASTIPIEGTDGQYVIFRVP